MGISLYVEADSATSGSAVILSRTLQLSLLLFLGSDLTDRWDTIDKMLEFELQISNFEGIAFLNLDIFVMLQTFPYFVRLGCSHFLHNYI